jgi:hypothetical protein
LLVPDPQTQVDPAPHVPGKKALTPLIPQAAAHRRNAIAELALQESTTGSNARARSLELNPSGAPCVGSASAIRHISSVFLILPPLIECLGTAWFALSARRTGTECFRGIGRLPCRLCFRKRQIAPGCVRVFLPPSDIGENFSIDECCAVASGDKRAEGDLTARIWNVKSLSGQPGGAE